MASTKSFAQRDELIKCRDLTWRRDPGAARQSALHTTRIRVSLRWADASGKGRDWREATRSSTSNEGDGGLLFFFSSILFLELFLASRMKRRLRTRPNAAGYCVPFFVPQVVTGFRLGMGSDPTVLDWGARLPGKCLHFLEILWELCMVGISNMTELCESVALPFH